uniref:GDSL esterase/lipase n=1 Tax=Ananas comosus var. bracteatus TaxID=296719 RepID=A0A6V7NZW0_ANACO|nr:unnamed protein product [Ananas comosus var. bracteatus]
MIAPSTAVPTRPQPSLRPDLLRPRHRPLLQRPPHRRLLSPSIRIAVPSAVSCGTDGGGFPHGANFAVAGATAMNGSFFDANGVTVTWTEYSLGTQLQWFKKLLPLISSDSDRSKIMNSSLFLVGEIGGNDYNHPLFQGKTIEEVRSFVPSVINTIGSAINDLIELGARTLVVPGNFPMGCVPTYLIEFQSPKEEDYDPQTGCLKQLNEFAEYHNRQLLNELDKLQRLHPHATIIYADYYGPSMNVYRSPEQFGIKAPLNACCGSDAPYNYTHQYTAGARSRSYVPIHQSMFPGMGYT